MSEDEALPETALESTSRDEDMSRAANGMAHAPLPQDKDEPEIWDWDGDFEMPPPEEKGTIRARLIYRGDNPPLQMIYPDDLLPCGDVDADAG